MKNVYNHEVVELTFGDFVQPTSGLVCLSQSTPRNSFGAIQVEALRALNIDLLKKKRLIFFRRFSKYIKYRIKELHRNLLKYNSIR